MSSSYRLQFLPAASGKSERENKKRVKHDNCDICSSSSLLELSHSPKDVGGAGMASEKIIKSAAQHDLGASQTPQRCFISLFSSKSAFITVCTAGILSGIFPLIILSPCQMKLSSVPENNISLYKAVKPYSSPQFLAGCEPPIFTHRSICY